MTILIFLAHHPASPASTISAFTGVSDEHLSAILPILQGYGLAEKFDGTSVAGRPYAGKPTLWSATDDAIKLRAMRELASVSLALKRYRFFREDAHRRPNHTLATHRFFERAQRDVDARARAVRRLDTHPNTLNEGHIPFYEFPVYEAELTAADRYVAQGAARHFRPDGYGALRAGLSWTRFWLELDGTTQSPATASTAVWAAKLGRLCDYQLSNRWTLRSPDFPRLFIVTTDLRTREIVYDALIEAARARQMAPPSVWIAGQGAVKQRGPLGRVWFDINGDLDTEEYGFDDVQPLGVVTSRQLHQKRDLIAEMNRAQAMGLLDAPLAFEPEWGGGIRR